jgi:pilus assembly protein FimV
LRSEDPPRARGLFATRSEDGPLAFTPKKRKTLEAAQKYAQKGSYDKALVEYEKLLKADPKDSNLRLKIGDLHLKKGDKSKAIQTYQDVADMFSRGGFDAKAVAIYKQILRVEDESLEARTRLGECFQRMGLTSDALREFQDAFKICQKRELKREAFELLRRLASLDPSNVANRLNLAGLFARENLLDDAKREFTSLLEEVRRQTGTDLVVRVAEQMLHAFPDSREALEALAWAKLSSGAHGEAVKLLKPAIAKHPDDIPLRESLVSAYEGAGDENAAKLVWREIAELYKRRGDLDKSREILQRHAAVAEFGRDESTTPSLVLTDATKGPIGGGDDADDVDLELDEPAPVAKPAQSKPATAKTVAPPTPRSLVEKGRATPPPLRTPSPPPPAKKPVAPAASPEDSASDLLAEARVSLEFGDPEEAVRLVKRVLELDPGSKDAKELLAKAEGGAAAESSDIEIEIDGGGDVEVEAGDDDAMGSLIERTAFEESGELTEPTNVPLPALETAKPADDVADDTGPALEAFAPGEDFDTLPDIEIVLEDEEDKDEKFASVEPPLEVELNRDEPKVAKPAPLAAKMPAPAKPAPAPAKPPTPTPVIAKSAPKPVPEPELEPAASDDFDIEIEVEGATPEPEPDLEPAAPSAKDSEVDPEPSLEFSRPLAGESPEDLADFEDASSRVMENLTEADFYLDQGLVDEAERIYRSVLERVPGHPKAMLRLGEIDAQRAKKGAPRKTEPAKIAGDPLGDTMVREPDGREALSLPEIPAPAAEEAPFEPSVLAEETIPPLVLERAPADQVVVAQDTVPPFAPAEADELEESAHGSDEEGEFDLAKMLDDDEDDHTGTVGTLMKVGAVGKGFADVFSAFKKGIQEQVDEGDADTHYDLAIAYKEMGLNEDAARELEIVLRTGARAIEALSLLAHCKLALGDAPAAAALIEDALQRAGDSHESAVSLRYDLAEALLAAGREKEAREQFAKVAAVSPKFRDVLERLARFG